MFTLLTWLLIFPASAQAGVTVERIKSEYPAIFTLRFFTHEDKTFTAAVAEPPPEGHLLRGFVEENRHYLQYLIGNGTSLDAQGLLEENGDQEKTLRDFDSRLRDDARFNDQVLPMIDRWLHGRGIDLAGYDPPTRKEVTHRHMLDLAARFFYPDSIQKDGAIGSHICAGMNGLSDLGGEREIAVEAFAFQIIFGDLFEDRYGLESEFTEEVRSVGRLNLSSDPNTRLTRIQGAAWAHMARSRNLQRAVAREYRRRVDYLPFTLVEEAKGNQAGEGGKRR